MSDKEEEIEKIAAQAKEQPRVLIMPGNPRYQPDSIIPFWGYDNLVKPLVDVEWALLKVLVKLETIPPEAAIYLTEDVLQKLHVEITTTLQDAIENGITHHDIVALVEAMKEALRRILGEEKASLFDRYIHLLATSYDIIDSARILAYKQTFCKATLPSMMILISSLREKVLKFSKTVQVGRSHGQHGEPITVGFWLATILERMVNITEHMITNESELKGKFSGAMGACNSQAALGIEKKTQKMFGKSFEEIVLEELGLEPGPISTQILLPEPLARFLFEYTLLSGALAQLGTDIRQLARSEIKEVIEGFTKDQAGSSAMSHKRNPIRSEGVVGLHTIIKSEFHKVMDTLLSEHNRDATGMSVMREFPGIVVFVQKQIDVMNKVIPDLYINKEALKRNFDMNRHLILSEEVHLALILAGYKGDAHHFVNHTLVPISESSGNHLIDELLKLAAEDTELATAVRNIPPRLIELLRSPENVTGKAEDKALAVALKAKTFIDRYS